MLAKRLAHRGVVLTCGALAALLARNAASAGVPSSVLSSTISAANVFATGSAAVGGAISAKAAALTEGVLKAMMITKLKSASAALMLCPGWFTPPTARQAPSRRLSQSQDQVPS